MSEPSGAVIARPVLARACGCRQEFQHYARDPFRAGRQAKFEASRCPACAAAEAAKHNVVSKREAFARLPVGATLTVTRLPDGSWAGTLTAGGVTVEAVGPFPQPLTAALAQGWAGLVAADGPAPSP